MSNQDTFDTFFSSASSLNTSNTSPLAPPRSPSLDRESNSQSDQVKLSRFNRERLEPGFGLSMNLEKLLDEQRPLLLMEESFIRSLRTLYSQQVGTSVPLDPQRFMSWFEELKVTGPGQGDPLFDFLENDATYEQMKWFLKQEVGGEAGFDDLVALSQIKISTQPKLEMARNYWDEMGRGLEKGMHGPMLGRLAQSFDLQEKCDPAEIVQESLALSNLMVGLAFNRRYAYHSLGALGVIELTAPGRADKVYRGLQRLGVEPRLYQYYLLHSTLDKKHSADWNREVILPLVMENTDLIPLLAEGAWMRLYLGAQCFERYKKEFQKTGGQ